MIMSNPGPEKEAFFADLRTIGKAEGCWQLDPASVGRGTSHCRSFGNSDSRLSTKESISTQPICHESQSCGQCNAFNVAVWSQITGIRASFHVGAKTARTHPVIAIRPQP